MNVFSLQCCIAVLLILPSPATMLRAGTMLSPTAVLGTDLGTFDPTTPLENMINQSSLDKPFTSGVTDFDEYFTTGTQPFGQGGPGNWQSDFSFNLPLMGFIDFDLGAVYSIDRIAIWNRSLEDGNFLVSQTLGGPMENAGSFHLLNRLNFPFSYLPEIVELDDTEEARYLRFEITSTYKFAITDTFAYAIVGEVVVETVTTSTADYNFNGIVDTADYVVWRDGGSPDDSVAGYNLWKANFSQSGSGARTGGPVPEPSSVVLALIPSLAGIWRMAEKQVATPH